MRPLLLLILVPWLAQAAEPWPRLYSAEASATSFLRNNWNTYQENYHPSYVLDDDPKTAWVEGAEGDGVGESLTIPLSSLASARAVRLVIFNGYQKSPALLAANAAPKQLTVTVKGPAGTPSARQQLTLEKQMGPQSFDIPVKGGVSEVVLTLDSVHPGSKYRDTCISDVRVFVDSDVKYNASAEQGKRKALLGWKKARVADAKYYASLPKDYPYASTHFEKTSARKILSPRYVLPPGKTAEEVEVDDASLKPNKDFVPLRTLLSADAPAGGLSPTDWALIQELETLASTPSEQKGSWYALSFKKRIVPPENFSVAGSVRDALQLAEGSLFEAQGPGPLTLKTRAVDYYELGEGRTNLLLLEGTASDVKKVFFTATTTITERSTTTTTTQVLALYEAGRLSRLVSMEMTEDDGESGPLFQVSVSVPTWREGKLTRLSTQTVEEVEDHKAFVLPQAGLYQHQVTLQAVSES
ncbi:NADase-type glycan-binding domain-containing protein [Archangium primigenium]|uniref:NADase-type glycan-binding domain-containing protein n=1 Tax=[Archangium] primigenium TaxID=2792470 RepID=UPI0019595317|nr:hypothetical protein [Archangium primigenium]MBM7117444.1 hypothetical protein [Archangium primigenium]